MDSKQVAVAAVLVQPLYEGIIHGRGKNLQRIY